MEEEGAGIFLEEIMMHNNNPQQMPM